MTKSLYCAVHLVLSGALVLSFTAGLELRALSFERAEPLCSAPSMPGDGQDEGPIPIYEIYETSPDGSLTVFLLFDLKPFPALIRLTQVKYMQEGVVIYFGVYEAAYQEGLDHPFVVLHRSPLVDTSHLSIGYSEELWDEEQGKWVTESWVEEYPLDCPP